MELMTSVKSRIHVLIKTVYFITLSCQEGINKRAFLYSANMKWNKSEYKYLLWVHRSTFRHNTFLVIVNVCYCWMFLCRLPALRTRDTHTYSRTFGSGAVSTCFCDLGLGFEHMFFRLQGGSTAAACLFVCKFFTFSSSKEPLGLFQPNMAQSAPWDSSLCERRAAPFSKGITSTK